MRPLDSSFANVVRRPIGTTYRHPNFASAISLDTHDHALAKGPAQIMELIKIQMAFPILKLACRWETSLKRS